MIDNGNGIYGNEILYIGLISMKVCKCNFRMDFSNNMEMMSSDVRAKAGDLSFLSCCTELECLHKLNFTEVKFLTI